MSPVRIYGDQGYSELKAPTQAVNTSLILPSGTGTSGQYLQTSGASGALSWVTPTSASWTAVNTAASSSSGTIEFTGLPSDIDQLIFSWNNLNSTANASLIIDIGTSSGYATSGYKTNSGYLQNSNTVGVSRYTTAWNIRGSATSGNTDGCFLVTKNNGNIWQIFGMVNDDSTDLIYVLIGSCSLSGTFERIRIRAESGNFDAQGSATVQYLRIP